MSLFEAIRVALNGVNSNKMRSGLTCLGIIIGVGAVIAMVAMGQGASAEVQEGVRSFGANLLTVQPGQATQGRVRQGSGTRESLALEDAAAIAEECEDVKAATAETRTQAQVKYGNANTSTSITGYNHQYCEIMNNEVASGRFFTEQEDRAGRKVAVLGETVAENLFEGEDPLGKRIQIRKVRFEVIGVLGHKDSFGPSDANDDIVVPINTSLRRVANKDYVDHIQVMAVSEGRIDAAKSEIEELLRQRHRIRQSSDDDFHVRTQTEILTTLGGTTQTFTMLLAGIAAISLLVGGIGIMNIMLVSVTERTREIGIRKAIGAAGRDILLQFLVESVTLCAIGGVAGIGLGMVGAKLVSQFAGWNTLVSAGSVVLSFSFAVGVGVFFGLYPARKAAAMDPIEALRYE